jgi:hypothetical protein
MYLENLTAPTTILSATPTSPPTVKPTKKTITAPTTVGSERLLCLLIPVEINTIVPSKQLLMIRRLPLWRLSYLSTKVE